MSLRRAAFLPDGVDELVGDAAWAAEALRRKLLDHYRSQGYALLLPPLVEHLDSLLVGAGEDLEEQTFRFVDPASGRMLGVRADMTPQAARVAATRFAGRDAVRLCYLGSVLRTHPDAPGGPRSPRQVGCELFGEAGIGADIEILRLLVDTLELAGLRQPLLDLGHVGIYSALTSGLDLDAGSEQALFELVQCKALPDLERWLQAHDVDEAAAAGLRALPELAGDPEETLARAREQLPDHPAIVDALEALARVAGQLALEHGHVTLHVDLGELRGYRYQTGLSFAAFAPGASREIARGGRYDGIGAVYGAPRPATGFSADLNELLDWPGDA